ncbi:MAG: MurR/RpiR family transcriptional regulator [Chloroflexi bacterium]|nr:MurR/RpiR family transcriptional regulator [Chloroflexota bacterium]
MLLERIRQVYPQLTKSQKALADFVSNDYREVAFMTASAMARHLSLNEATVIRFTQRLGYPGYPEFVEAVQSIIRDELRTRNGAEQRDPFRRVLQVEVDVLQRTISYVPTEAWQKAVSLMQEAERIIVLGQGLAGALAELLAVSLSALGFSAHSPLTDALSLALTLDGLRKRDAVVAISVTWPSPEVANAVAHARKKGVPTLALSSSPVSPCAQAADVAISWPPEKELLVPPVTPAAMLIDALVQSLSYHDGDQLRRRLEGVHQLGARLRGWPGREGEYAD